MNFENSIPSLLGIDQKKKKMGIVASAGLLHAVNLFCSATVKSLTYKMDDFKTTFFGEIAPPEPRKIYRINSNSFKVSFVNRLACHSKLLNIKKR